MRPCAFLPLLLLPLCGCSHHTPAAGGTPAAMDYRDLADVQALGNPSAPLQIVTSREVGGSGSMTSFVVTAPWHGLKPGQTFRDGAHIAADEAAHRGKPAALKAEARAWDLLLQNSPVIVTQADLEPRCEAHLSGGASSVSLSETFTPAGTEKIASYTKHHTGGIIGIIVDGRVLSAPLVMEPITSGQGEISGGFRSLTDGQGLADRLNGAAGQTRKP